MYIMYYWFVTFNFIYNFYKPFVKKWLVFSIIKKFRKISVLFNLVL